MLRGAPSARRPTAAAPWAALVLALLAACSRHAAPMTDPERHPVEARGRTEGPRPHAANAPQPAASADPIHAPDSGSRASATVPVLPPAASAEPATASIEGTVRWAGSAPLKVKELTNTIDVATCGARVHLNTIAWGSGGTIANVVLELRHEDGSPVLPPPGSQAGKPPPLLPVEVRRCALQPHVLVVPLGSGVEVSNPDGILHDLLAFSLRNPLLEARLPRYRRRLVVPATSLQRPERIKVTCDVHPWLVGWWVVTDAPLHAMTGLDGRFRIDGLPPGRVRLHAWHEALGELDREVLLEAGAVAQVDIDLK